MTTTRLRSALWLPLFGDLADPIVLARLAAEAEATGWDGLFVWDQMYWREPVRQIADPWIALAEARGGLDGYDLAVGLGPGVDPEPYKKAGATWWLPEIEPGAGLDTVHGLLRDGPADPGGS